MRAGEKRKPGRVAVLLAVGLAVLAAVFVALAPMRRSVTTTVDSRGRSTTSRETYSLLESEGAGILVVASLPVVIALVPLLMGRFGRARAFTVALVIATTLMGLFVFVGGFSIGLLYAPAFIALLVATVQAQTAPAAAAE